MVVVLDVDGFRTVDGECKGDSGATGTDCCGGCCTAGGDGCVGDGVDKAVVSNVVSRLVREDNQTGECVVFSTRP